MTREVGEATMIGDIIKDLAHMGFAYGIKESGHMLEVMRLMRDVYKEECEAVVWNGEWGVRVK